MARETLTKDQIVRVAIEILDSEGMEGLNMRALGRRLGSAATAVYWHVGSKDHLIADAADEAWKEIELPEPSAIDWRTAATQLATGLHEMLLRHPWLVQAFGSFLLFSPGKARHDDCNLAVYESAGFVGVEADQASAAVFTFVLGNALGPAATTSLTRKLDREGGDADERIQANAARLREMAAQFPRLAVRLGTAADDYGSAPGKTFEFGLQAILDGLEARLVARSRRG